MKYMRSVNLAHLELCITSLTVRHTMFFHQLTHHASLDSPFPHLTLMHRTCQWMESKMHYLGSKYENVLGTGI